MMYKMTLNMASHKGYPSHQIFAEHELENIHDLMKKIAKDGFIVVREHYKGDGDSLVAHGELGISCDVIGKVTYLDADIS